MVFQLHKSYHELPTCSKLMEAPAASSDRGVLSCFKTDVESLCMQGYHKNNKQLINTIMPSVKSQGAVEHGNSPSETAASGDESPKLTLFSQLLVTYQANKSSSPTSKPGHKWMRLWPWPAASNRYRKPRNGVSAPLPYCRQHKHLETKQNLSPGLPHKTPSHQSPSRCHTSGSSPDAVWREATFTTTSLKPFCEPWARILCHGPRQQVME